MSENLRKKRWMVGLMATALMWSGLACTPHMQGQGGQPTPAEEQQGEPSAPVPPPAVPVPGPEPGEGAPEGMPPDPESKARRAPENADGDAVNGNHPVPAESQELPPIPPVKGEAQPNDSLAEWASQVSQAGERGLSPEQEIKLIGEVLAVAQRQLADEETVLRLFMYKYPLRYLSERLH